MRQIFLKNNLLFNSFLSFMLINKTLRLSNLKTRTAMNGNVQVLVVCVEAIIYLLYLISIAVPLRFKLAEKIEALKI